VSGPKGIVPNGGWAVFPLENPGIVSIPLSFLLGVVGTYVGGSQGVDHRRTAEMEVRSLTGAGSEKAVVNH
jgi:cation/acetate symporter